MPASAPLPDDIASQLRTLRDERDPLNQARAPIDQAIERLVVEAIDAGHQVQAIATAAGISRVSAYKAHTRAHDRQKPAHPVEFEIVRGYTPTSGREIGGGHDVTTVIADTIGRRYAQGWTLSVETVLPRRELGHTDWADTGAVLTFEPMTDTGPPHPGGDLR